MPAPAIVWFRRDLRLADHPALHAALTEKRPIVALFVLDEVSPGRRPLGSASRWWLHQSLSALDAALRARGNRLLLRRGAAETVLPQVAAACGAEALHWNRAHEPGEAAADAVLADRLARLGLRCTRHEGNDLLPPDALQTAGGGPYKVFTPFWNALQRACPEDAPLPAPARLTPPNPLPPSDLLDDLRLLAGLDALGGALAVHWTPGEAAATEALQGFVAGPVAHYSARHDLPAEPGTSRLSPHLAWGDLSPRQVWQALNTPLENGAARRRPALASGTAAVLRQLGWRAFARSLLHHWPDLPHAPWRPAFAEFPWRNDAAALAAWREGRTGYPWVDAGLRELRATGFMHNRVRMAAASFLAKHLLLPWQRGEAWFWEALVDADPANNALNWQWVAGCGPDAAPYFRIFNPVRQGQRFDPGAAYIRRWVPELAALPDAAVHAPWQAPAALLREVGVRLGTDYPHPMVDHGESRTRALAAHKAMRSAVQK